MFSVTKKSLHISANFTMEDYDYLDLFTSTLKARNTRQFRDKGQNDNISIIVGGKKFETCRNTMDAIPGSLLSEMNIKSPNYNNLRKAYNFDRDPTSFNEIIEAHRSRELHTPRGVCPIRFKKELEFWKIPISLMMPCCWKHFYEVNNDLEILDNILQNRTHPDPMKKVESSRSGRGDKMPLRRDKNGNNWVEPERTLRYRVWLLLEEPATSTAAKLWCFFYIFMVVLSVLIFMLWLEPSLRVNTYLTHIQIHASDKKFLLEHDEKIASITLLDAHPVVFGLDCVCIAFFILEATVLTLVCPNRGKLIKSPYYIVKIFVCLAMVGGFIIDVDKAVITSLDISKVYVYLKGITTLRLLLIFRIQKLYNRLQIVLLSLQKSIKELLLLIFVFMVTIVIYGGMMYCGELDTDSFPNIRHSCWWALITMTTIGYGDFYPTGTLGYIIAGVCAIQGLVVISLPIAAIASVFSTYYNRSADLNIHENFIKSQHEKFEDGMERNESRERSNKIILKDMVF